MAALTCLQSVSSATGLVQISLGKGLYACLVHLDSALCDSEGHILHIIEVPAELQWRAKRFFVVWSYEVGQDVVWYATLWMRRPVPSPLTIRVLATVGRLPSPATSWSCSCSED